MTDLMSGELTHCLPIRLTAELERGIREHRAYLQRRMLRRVSLAEACRDLFARALQFSPTRVGARRRKRARSVQLGLSFTPKGARRALPSPATSSETGAARADSTGGSDDAS